MLPVFRSLLLAITCMYLLSGCLVLRENAKYNFNDGVYTTKRFSRDKVYVLHVDDDTISVFPVKEYGDSTAIITSKRVNYTSMQRKFKDKLLVHTFYKPSFDFDVMTIPLKYRPARYDVPNQLNTNFNGALFGGYRIDAYKLQYRRTPLNVYKQSTKHIGYSGGVFVGVGSSFINPWVLNDPSINVEYEGVLLVSGVALNMAMDKISFGVALGFDHLMDRYANNWIYNGQPCVGFTLGLDLY